MLCFFSAFKSENIIKFFALFFRIEIYCRELTERFEDIWVVSGPLTLPQTGGDGKKIVSYQVGTCFNLQAYAVCMRLLCHPVFYVLFRLLNSIY